MRVIPVIRHTCHTLDTPIGVGRNFDFVTNFYTSTAGIDTSNWSRCNPVLGSPYAIRR